MSDAGDEADEEIDEAPGVDEWIAVESEADAIPDGLEEGPSEQERPNAS